MRPELLELEELFFWGGACSTPELLDWLREKRIGFTELGWQYFRTVWGQLNCRN